MLNDLSSNKWFSALFLNKSLHFSSPFISKPIQTYQNFLFQKFESEEIGGAVCSRYSAPIYQTLSADTICQVVPQYTIRKVRTIIVVWMYRCACLCVYVIEWAIFCHTQPKHTHTHSLTPIQSHSTNENNKNKSNWRRRSRRREEEKSKINMSSVICVIFVK